MIKKIGKFYSGIIVKNIGIFIFIGFMSVLFHEQGWFPNENLYAISRLVYHYILPIMLGYETGIRLAGQEGAVVSILTVAGFLAANIQIGMLGAMLISPVAAKGYQRVSHKLEERIQKGMEMLVKNIMTGVTGAGCAIVAFYFAEPLLGAFQDGMNHGINWLIQNHLIGFASVLIEPAKILFLNNSINHGVLDTVGMLQAQDMGKSVLFLLETNPGPGFGVLLALYVNSRKHKREYRAIAAVEFLGGIHEVYFTYVLSNLWLLLGVTAGGMTANIFYNWVDAGLAAPVAPGSALLLPLLAGRSDGAMVAAGILLAAIVSFGVNLLVLKIQKREERTQPIEQIPLSTEMSHEESTKEMKEEIKRRNKEMRIQTVGFVCDAGVGSSAMGAALFRRLLRNRNETEIQVTAHSVDQIPEQIDLIVCQKDFMRFLPKVEGCEICPVENLVETKGLEEVIEKYFGGEV